MKTAKPQKPVKLAELKKMNQELERFVYSASHDLKAPLRSIMGIVNIAKTETQDEKQALYLDMIYRSASKLSNFINDLTNFSRNSRLEVLHQKIDFNEILQETMESMSYMDSAHNFEVNATFEGLPFYSDISRLKIIFSNLISNAIKYQRNDSKIIPKLDLTVTVSKSKAMLIFADNGEGIPAEHQKSVFKMFYRASERSQGSGLGLFIIKEVVKKLNGKIKLESVPNQGTTFTLTIPNSKL